MQAMTYTQVETNYDGFKVILEFPNKSNHEAAIKKEIEQLLSGLLKEQAVQFM